jgi:hypothetical protein
MSYHHELMVKYHLLSAMRLVITGWGVSELRQNGL